MSLSTDFMGTEIYDMFVEIAEQHSDDFAVQEQFIEALLYAYVTATGAGANAGAKLEAND